MTWCTLWSLARASNFPTVWSNVLAGWLLSWQPWHGGVGWALAGGTLVYAGGCTLNDAFDARWDREHRPERPIPSGVISEHAVWAAGILELLLGLGLLLWAGCGGPVVAALGFSVLWYDWWHKRSAWAVVPMGLCRVFLGWAAASMTGWWWPPGALIAVWLSGLFCYIVGLSLVARREATDGSVSWAGLVLVLVPVAGTALANRMLGADFRDFLFVGFLFGLGAWRVGMILRDREVTGRVGQAVARMLAGIVVIDGMWVAQMRWEWAAGWVTLLAACLIWQRWVAAT
ncbi:MAG: UbiA family prenyltransferase [Verrucomicrobiales bacterium]